MKCKSEWDARCDACGADFSVAHGGCSDIAKHIGSVKHKQSVSAAANSSTATWFFRQECAEEKELTRSLTTRASDQWAVL